MINGHNYARSAELALAEEAVATLLLNNLMNGRLSYQAQGSHISGVRCPASIGRAIEMLRTGYPKARCFLPALHTHQIALWFEGRC